MKFDLLGFEKKNGSMKFLKEYSETEFNNIINASSDLSLFLDFDRAWRILYINLISQKNYMSQLMEHGISKEVQFRQDEFELIRRALSVDLFNVLSGFYFFIEFCTTNFTRWFGKESDEYQFLVQKLSEYFDTYFEYRFFYKLRNFAVHCGLPIQGLFNATGDNGKLLFVAMFNRKFLLENFDGWGGPVKSDLNKLKNDIPIFTSVINFGNMIVKLHKEIKDYLLNLNSDSVKLIKDEMAELSVDYYDLRIWKHEGPENLEIRWAKQERISFEEFMIETVFLESI